ncbi:MAG: SDR family oxidoreductase [Actinobacteria bacterium]|nr:SDR family oxidoreductase [Actinomycetota bacterium]
MNEIAPKGVVVCGGDLISTSPEDYRFVMDVNLTTAWLSCRSGAPRLVAAGGGAILNVGSKSALSGGTGEAAYSVAKAAVVRVTQVLAHELKDKGVRVNAILPAVIDTPANRESLPQKLVTAAASPEDIASVISYLCSDDAALISGASIPVFGELLG